MEALALIMYNNKRKKGEMHMAGGKARQYHGVKITTRHGKTKDTYQARIRVRRASGKGSDVRTVSADTMDDIKKKIDAAMSAPAVTHSQKERAKFEDVWQLFYNEREASGMYQPNTLIDYATKYKNHYIYFNGYRMQEITGDRIADFVAYISGKPAGYKENGRAKSYSVRSQKDILNVLMAFMRWARQNGYTSEVFDSSDFMHNTSTAKQKEKQRNERGEAFQWYTSEEFERYLDTWKGDEYENRRIMYCIMFFAGLRVSEVYGLRFKDITGKPGEYSIEVNNKATKSRDGEGRYSGKVSNVLKSPSAHRIIPIPDELAKRIEAYRQLKKRKPSDLVMDTSFNGVTASHRSHNMTIEKQNEKLPEGERLKTITIHEMRKSCLTRWARVNKLDNYTLTTLAGHSSISTTKQYYIGDAKKQTAEDARRQIFGDNKQTERNGEE